SAPTIAVMAAEWLAEIQDWLAMTASIAGLPPGQRMSPGAPFSLNVVSSSDGEPSAATRAMASHSGAVPQKRIRKGFTPTALSELAIMVPFRARTPGKVTDGVQKKAKIAVLRAWAGSACSFSGLMID